MPLWAGSGENKRTLRDPAAVYRNPHRARISDPAASGVNTDWGPGTVSRVAAISDWSSDQEDEKNSSVFFEFRKVHQNLEDPSGHQTARMRRIAEQFFEEGKLQPTFYRVRAVPA